MATEMPTWTPDWTVTPGEVLEEALEERGLSQSELARRMDRPIKTINEIVNGKAAVTPTTAIQLERALGIEAGLWMGLESNYRQAIARAKDFADLEAERGFLADFPIKDLITQGFLDDAGASDARTLGRVLQFFGVSNPTAWRNRWAAPALLRESATFKSNEKALAAWLRIGDLLADRMDVTEYDADRWSDLLIEARSWTRQVPFATVVGKLIARSAEVGVAVVVVPEVAGTHVSGATHATDRGVPVLQLSLRHKRDDQFWFSFFHEARHVLQSPGHTCVDEDGASGAAPLEADADKFAREILVPADALTQLVAQGDLSEQAIKQFAKEIGVAAGIVVGRLQRDDIVPPNQLNYLKKTVRFANR